MRGRLIFPVLAELFRGDVPAQQDDDFKEPVGLDDIAAPQPVVGEPKGICLKCQVEPDEVSALNMQANGDAPRSKIHLVFHVRDLKAANFVPMRRDRLLAIRSRNGEVLWDAAEPALVAVECRPQSFGLGRCSVANLLRVTFISRFHGIRSNA